MPADDAPSEALSQSTATRSIFFIVLGWQFVAFLLACINVFSELLEEYHNWRTPTLMNAPMYLLLFLFTIIRSCILSKSNRSTPIEQNHSPDAAVMNQRLLDEHTTAIQHTHQQQSQSVAVGDHEHDDNHLGNVEFIKVDRNTNSLCIQPHTETSPALSDSDSSSLKSYNSTENMHENITCSSDKKPEISHSHSIASPSGYLHGLLCKTKHIPQLYYLLGAIADVEGNVLLLTAYEYTTITSVSLLDCFAIPMVMLWGALLFGRAYQCNHYVGISIALAGMALMVYTDSIVNKTSNHGSNPVLGDILVLCGATCYSVSNSFAEYVVKHYQSIWRYLRMIGIYGFVITLIQGLVFEHHALLHSNEYSLSALMYLLGYVMSLSTYYILIPTMLQYSSAVVMNLSLLSADFWAVLAALLFFSVRLNYLYFVAFVAIVGGVIWYNVANHRHKSLSN